MLGSRCRKAVRFPTAGAFFSLLGSSLQQNMFGFKDPAAFAASAHHVLPMKLTSVLTVVTFIACSANGQTSSQGTTVSRGSDGATGAKPEIEFRVLLIIKRLNDTYSPLFLPIRAQMTDAEIASARRCFELETPDMVHEITGGKVRFVPTVRISDKPLRIFNPDRLDSAEYSGAELLNELATFAKPGEFDSAGYLFLHYDTASGYKIPRAGYGVGGYDGEHRLGMFAINCTPRMNPRDEIFLHEWMHGLDGFYGGKNGVKLPKSALHGASGHGYREKPFHPGDTFHGWMEWYRDYFNCCVQEDGKLTGLGSNAWKQGPMRSKAGPVDYRSPMLPVRAYPEWVYELMKGDLSHALLGPSLLEKRVEPGALSNTPWQLEVWNKGAGTEARVLPDDGGTFMLSNKSSNDAGLVRTLSLEPFRNYVFSAEIRTEGIAITEAGGKFGATLRAGDSTSSRELVGTTAWTTIALPFTTGAKAQSMRLKMGVGGNSSVASGRAFFRNVQVRKIGYPATNLQPK